MTVFALLLVNPPVQIFSTETPLAANLECRKFAFLSHRIHGLLGHPQQAGDLLERQDLV